MDFVEKYLTENTSDGKLLKFFGVAGNMEMSISAFAYVLRLKSTYTIVLLALGIIFAVNIFGKINAVRKLELISLTVINVAILFAILTIL